jgi:hypothetical protein
MVDKIQNTDHKKSQYDRLTGEWRCDGTRYGSACSQGPSSSGQCPHAKAGIRSLCEPKKNGGKFYCQRSDEAGGPCVNGPDEMGNCGTQLPPCRPKIGNLNRRKQWSKRMVVIGIAFLALILGSKHIMAWVQSDNLSLYHRNVSECSNCHEGIDNSFSTWWMQGNYHLWANEPAKSYSCTDCHQFNGPPMKAHNLDKQSLFAIQQSIHESVNEASFEKNIACHQCHNEHQGAYGVDAILDNQQCQSCHSKQFSGFDKTHPEFHHFPESKSQRPQFDHKKHFRRFSQKKYKSSSPENCQSCHLPDMADEVVLPSFETACKDCHLEKDILNIGGKQTTAISWLSVPRFDAEALTIGQWPNCKTIGSYSIDDMSPITLSYLEQDPEVKTAIEILSRSSIRFDKSEKATDEELAAMTTLAWGFKKLLSDLKSNKDIHWHEDRAKSTNIKEKISKINSDLLTVFIQEMFPSLEEELKNKESLPPGQCMSKDNLSSLRKKWGKPKINSMQGWYIQVNNKTMELGYRTQQHMDLIQQNIMDQYWMKPELFQWLTEKKKSLNCQKCHTANETNDGWIWKQEPIQFTTNFYHKPHLISASSCQDCHRINDTEKQDGSGVKEFHFQSDFLSLSKSDCQSCHNNQGSTDQCTDCHSYHKESIMLDNYEQTW